jgi:hypothetical protein
MTTWDQLGEDPAPGAPAEVHEAADRLDAAAAHAAGVARALQGLVLSVEASGLRGPAEQGVRTVLGQLVPRLAEVAAAYDQAATALRRYAERLAELQRRAGALLEQAGELEPDRAHAHAGEDAAELARVRAAVEALREEAVDAAADAARAVLAELPSGEVVRVLHELWAAVVGTPPPRADADEQPVEELASALTAAVTVAGTTPRPPA